MSIENDLKVKIINLPLLFWILFHCFNIFLPSHLSLRLQALSGEPETLK